MKQFFEFTELKEFALVTSVAQLFEIAAAPGKARFSITSEVGDYVRLSSNASSIPDLKECKFQLLQPEGDGCEYISFDKKGKPSILSEKPDWAMDESVYAREQWVVNLGFDSALLERLMTYPLDQRRKIADLLLSLELDKKPVHRMARYNTGNKNGKSTKPKVLDLGSYELFRQVYDRLSSAVNSDQFPTLQILTGYEDLPKAPTNLKQACRTYFKAITSQLPPNNKVTEKGGADLYCAPLKTVIEEVERVGVENYYNQLAAAIDKAASEETTIADFRFHYRED